MTITCSRIRSEPCSNLDQDSWQLQTKGLPAQCYMHRHLKLHIQLWFSFRISFGTYRDRRVLQGVRFDASSACDEAIRKVPISFASHSTYAWVPSTASKVWYRNSPIAQEAYTHGGMSWSRVGLYHNKVKKFTTTKLKPESVICWFRENFDLRMRVRVRLTALGLQWSEIPATQESVESCTYAIDIGKHLMTTLL